MKFWLALVAFVALSGGFALAQSVAGPATNLPDPFQAPQYNWAIMPDNEPWGSSAGIEIGPHKEIWAIGRCGANSCEGSDVAPIRLLDLATGKPSRSIGAGLFVFPHGLSVDRDGNVWVTDAAASKDGAKGKQVVELSPDGRVLRRLGTAGIAGGGPNHFQAPSDIVTAPNGDIFVADGHSAIASIIPTGNIARIVKFSKDGKFIREWGKPGSGPGEFDNPHALALDSRGRLFVADRSNARIQIFDEDGTLLAEWKQFGRPSGMYIDKTDTLYVIDADSTPANHPGWPKGVWIGSAKTGKLRAFVPDDMAGEGVVVGPDGNLYGAVNVAPRGITKYAKR